MNELPTARTIVLVLLAACATTQNEPVEMTTVHTTRTHESRPADETAVSTTACDRGDLPACHAAALDAYYAPPSPDSDERARALFDRACTGGYAPSCNGLGTLHDQGRGVPQDHVAAVTLYRRACTSDGSTGCQHLAQALRLGRGVDKDEAAAARAEVRGSCLAKAALVKGAGSCPSLDGP